MSVFNRFCAKARSVAGKVTDKAEELVGSAARSVKIKALEIRIDEQYENLGKLIYRDLHIDEDLEDEKLALVATIDALYDELALLKDTEAVLDMYHNSGILKESEKFFITETPFDFYFELGRFFRRTGLLGAPHHRTRLFDFMFDYATGKGIKNFEKPLARDYLISCKGAPLPKWAGEKEGVIKKEILNEIDRGE